MLLIAGLVFLWLYDDYADGARIPSAAFILPPIAALGMAGLVDPRLLYAIGPRRRQFPASVRIAGAAVFAAGLAVSAYLLVAT